MKKIRLLLVLALLATSAGAWAQQQRVSVSVQNATVGSVIEQLERQTGLSFFFGNAQVDVNRRVSLNIPNGQLDAAVRQLLGAGFTPEYDGNVVVIRPANTTQQTARAAHGRVTDQNGRPVVGASVLVVNAPGRGTSTDARGNWVLSLQGLQNPRLVVQFMGMKPVEFAGTPGVHNVTLEQNVIQTETAVVSVNTGYQDIPRDRMTGAWQSESGKELEKSAFSGLDQALAGKISGLYVATTSGQPGVQAEMRIRGDNSISGIREPLWIVDGLPLQEGVASIKGLTSGDLQTSILNHGVGNISPADIESVTILKDAAATAIYGARAAAGVIIVKTRAGIPGKMRINYRGNFSLGTAPEQKLGFMNSSQKIDFETQLAEQFAGSTQLGTAGKLWNQLQRGEISQEAYNQTIGKMRGTNTNWFDEIYRTSFSHSHNVSVSGGSEKLTIYGSLNAEDQQGVLKSNRYNAFTGMLKMSYRPNEKLLADFSVDAAYRQSKNHNSFVDPFKYAVFANPYETADAYDGSWLGGNYSALGEGSKYTTFNILNELEKTGEKSITSDITATLRLNYQIRPWLKAEAYGRVGYATSLTERWADRGTYTSYYNYMLLEAFRQSSNLNGELPADYNNGFMAGSTARTPSYSMRAGLSANHTFGERHHTNAYVGTEVRSAESWVSSSQTAEFDALYQFAGFPEFSWRPDLTPAMSQALQKMARYVYGNKDRYASFYGSFTYSYDDRYVFNANARFDGAGTIYAKNRFTPLWSASVRWNLHNEAFMKSTSWVSELALRGVFGYTGQIDKTALPFAWMQLAPYQYDGDYYAGTTHFANPGIKWERKQERSIGLDYSLFNNVFGGSLNYYNNKTRDLLDRATVANSFGNTSPRINKGSLTNQGVELNFNLRLKLGEVRWLTSFNVARNVNKITDTYYKSPWDYETEKIGENWKGYSGAIEGYAVGTTFGYNFAGVNPETGNAMIYISDRARQALRAAGHADTDRWDTETDPMIDGMSTNSFLALSLTNIGNTSPKYYGGFGTTFQWRNWELSGSFTYATGRMLPTFDERNFSEGGRELTASRLNRLASTANRWRAPGDVTNIARYTTDQSNYAQMLTSDRFQKADYLSFNNISLSYTFAESLSRKIGMSQARLGFQIQNLATWSRYSGFDATSSDPFSYPRQRRYVLNLQLSF